MSQTAEAPSLNGDGPRREALAYREAVRASMKKYERGPGGGQLAVTDRELDQFLIECRLYNLEPIAGQIYAVWENGHLRATTTIDGLRTLAERTGLYDGQGDPEWCNAEGNWSDYWAGEGTPTAARVRVHKKGTKVPTTGTANWDDFAPQGDAGADSLWMPGSGKPAHMLSIRAEALALRKAFPSQLSGLYTAEELGISLTAIGGSVDGTHTDTTAVPRDIPASPGMPPAPVPGSPAPGPPSTPAPAPVPPPTPGPRIPTGLEGGEGPSVIVDDAAGQPSGAPASPAARRTLAETLAGGGYERLRGELTEALFDQMPDRLTDEEAEILSSALAEAEAAGVTAVELERNCKVMLTEDNVELRRRALLDWISERRRKAVDEAVASSEAAAASPVPATEEDPPTAAESGQMPSLLDADPGPEESP